ncbi:hypothetical protein RhiirA4_486862 [Rhizophagus irregularis]|uniref:Uncharacterized protein n=1 Tax=Rhizophagus irregularis TaxID=588596 RepID=A0A2I1HRY0_9GLOM|nr:hypothetical protein RhiirA4_486862 [Rhizophagus irregularis]
MANNSNNFAIHGCDDWIDSKVDSKEKAEFLVIETRDIILDCSKTTENMHVR